jgi:hypothetical protein
MTCTAIGAPDQPPAHHDQRTSLSGERPWSVKAMVALVGVAWAGIMTFNAIYMDDFFSGRSLGMIAFWTAILGAWMYWVWQGAPAAMGRLARLCSVLSAVSVVWLIVGNLFMKRFRDLGLDLDGSQWLRVNVSSVSFAVVSFAIFLLAHRADARRWAEARARERHAR